VETILHPDPLAKVDYDRFLASHTGKPEEEILVILQEEFFALQAYAGLKFAHDCRDIEAGHLGFHGCESPGGLIKLLRR
jgi:hypothetical protein